MRIMQLIDTLRPGGAERMAVNYFLALDITTGHESFLVTTRMEGLLAKNICQKANYYFLNKSFSFDLVAFLKLKRLISDNNIDVIQAHSSSWVWAVICKLTGSNVKVIWHDHYGNSEFLERRNSKLLRFFSTYFDGIISVNTTLKEWSEKELKFKKPLLFIPNFIQQNKAVKRNLEGDSKYKIVCVANFRPQKDHFNLFNAFEIIKKQFDISIHLFGRDFEDEYSKAVLKHTSIHDGIYYYGEQNNIPGYLQDADIAVISSKSEGLPLVLLEYGLAGLPVISTNVGEISTILDSFGILVPPGNSKDLAAGILYFLENPEIRKSKGENLQLRIKQLYSRHQALSDYLEFILSL